MERAWVQSVSESCQTWTWFQLRTPNPTTTHMARLASSQVAGVPVFDLLELRQQDNKPAPAKIAHGLPGRYIGQQRSAGRSERSQAPGRGPPRKPTTPPAGPALA